jgi:drug/metabolite transporter (DMT)-like permease
VFPLTAVPSTTRAYLAWIVVCLVWGTTYLAIRIALEGIPPFLMASFRWLAAGALLLGILALRGRRMPAFRHWPSLALLGVLLLGFGNGAVVWAEQTVPSGLTSVLVAAVPFWMVGIERLRQDHEPLTAPRLAGLLIGFGGILLLVWPELRVDGTGGFLHGVVATQIACLGWAIGSSSARRRRDEHVLVAAGVQMLSAGVALLVVGTVAGEWDRLAVGPRAITALVYLIGAGSLLGFSAYAYALKHLPVATVSLYAYVNPIIAVLLGTAILGEPLTARIAVAGVVVLAGVGLVRRAERR